jgi:hypothetical protein
MTPTFQTRDAGLAQLLILRGIHPLRTNFSAEDQRCSFVFASDPRTSAVVTEYRANSATVNFRSAFEAGKVLRSLMAQARSAGGGR